MSVSFDGFDIGSFLLGFVALIVVAFVGAAVQAAINKRNERRWK